jgi:hypothetical protein
MAQAWLRLAEKNDFIPPVASEPTPARSPTATADPAQASSAWVRWESVTKIFTDFALFSGLVAFVFAIVLAAATLLTLEHVKPFLLTRVR